MARTIKPWRVVVLAIKLTTVARERSGFFGSAFSGYPVRFFGIVLPAWAPKHDMLKDAFSVVHLVNSWVLVSALALHVAGTVKHALLERKLVSAVYHGFQREMCPHVLGWKEGREHALFFQVGGDSSQGLPLAGAWRCLDLSELSEVSIHEGRWRTGPGCGPGA